jgi:glutaredoxin
MNVIVYTRRDCPLCEKGIELAERVFGADQVALVDVDLDLDLMERYTNRVPVIETEDGVVIDEGIIRESTLRGFSFRR